MVDQDVERILADIRAQVIGESSAEVKSTTQGNGSAAAPERVVIDRPSPGNGYASLTVLARAWDRLPPLVSNRTGASARLELWIKAKIKRALRWITWEQVNFNAATHHTLIEVIETLTSSEQRLANLQSQFNAEAKTTREQLELLQRKLDAQGDDLKTQRAEIRTRKDQIEREQATLNQRQSALLAQVEVLQKTLNEFESRLSQLDHPQRLEELVNEFRERDERLLDEQRVCFKQLSLELTESQVLQDSRRRELEARIAKLEE
jgi:hypothetical protein